MATSLEDFPDELLHRIIESLIPYQPSPITIQMHHKPFTRSLDLYPVDSMSLVNRRLRRISIPMLFREVTIRLYLGNAVDEEQFRCLGEAFEHKAHLMPLIRNVSIDYKGLYDRPPILSSKRITGKDPETLLLIDVLSRCTRLEHLDLPREIAFGQGNQLPIIKALNSHPSDKIRLRFIFVKEWSLEDLDGWYLSRPYRNQWMGREREIFAVHHWFSSTPSFFLKTIRLDRAHECDTTPWRMAFASKMYPYSFDIGKRNIGQWSWYQTQENSVVKIDGEWLYNDIKLIFQDDIARGDVETVETLVRTLGEALPHPPDCPWLFVGIDFLSPVGEFLTSDNLIGILVRNMSHAGILNLGKFVCDILTRECSQILEPGSAVEEGSIPGFDSFCKRLKQAMPRLHRVSGETSLGRLVHV
ncbi:hypothetical protein K435DRAFT_868981 [Dendrothele bispora CBS 962.96]|uniref:Uncharacterized protein n=1 Tax=Dendrothele bispora (strain CBS 962.96) TaxID=1314807 RepID=A0A4S8LAC3_DENBC|nr:hypothetical protein K435DRAFT_868981 [Dendrothele bispora CBS 962.96]